jgi:2-oxoglutarate dehydrogenase E2 component (dihydrolipoamide succinyltransferase)
MAIVEIIMPKMGESIMEARVLQWLKKVGDRIEADEMILEVATDKIDTEVPCDVAGILHTILVHEGDMALIGKPICLLETSATESPSETEDPTPKAIQLETQLSVLQQSLTSVPAQETDTQPSTSVRFYSPLVRTIAQQEGITLAELEQVPGTGLGGRLTKHDMLSYVQTRTQTPMASSPAPSVAIVGGQDEIIQMDRMRRMIAERMVASKHTAPHVTSFVETDMTQIVRWRERVKGQFQREYGENITYTPLLVEAVVKAIKDFPAINASVQDDKIILKRAINIGLAVALPNGNLIVPVIHKADQYSLVGLTQKINDLSKRARENKLKAEDLEGGTYTISNIGTFGNIMGTPIILQPQVAIMAFGAIQKKPAVIETPEGDFIGIRQQMFISHSYDHRVVDGSLGGQFVKRVSDYLEKFDPNRGFV